MGKKSTENVAAEGGGGTNGKSLFGTPNTTNTKYYMQQLQPMSQTKFVAATANIAYSDAVCALAPANSDTANVPTYFELHSNLLFFFL